MSLNKKISTAIVYPSGKLHKTQDEKIHRIEELKKEGFEITDLEPILPSDGITAGPVLERAALLAHALTNRKFSILMAARGGYGTTDLIPFLDAMLPPVLPPKTLVGFSDISYLGVYLSLRFGNFRYIHAKNAFSTDLFLDEHAERDVLFGLLKTTKVDSAIKLRDDSSSLDDSVPRDHNKLSHTFSCNVSSAIENTITGFCIPMNLSLAESLAATREFSVPGCALSLQHISLPADSILFLEDCNEAVYRSLRKLDSLINSGLLNSVIAIVLGNFSDNFEPAVSVEDATQKHNQKAQERQTLIKLFAEKTNKPVIDFPLFGHEKNCFPLVAHSKVRIEPLQHCFQKDKQETNAHHQTQVFLQLFPMQMNLRRPLNLATERTVTPNSTDAHVHLCGIGGTGMASVAGLLTSAGYHVSGSDKPLYPPMSNVLADLKIVPDVGFKKENITERNIDFIVMGNVMSRKTSELQKNEELEEILARRIPVMSFPSALRRVFLSQSFNIVVSGTHGKTTTSSLFAHVLTHLGENPSFLIGGIPGNFGQGFCLKSHDLFVLEGDEYDCAFFDKGPKFLHYEPNVALLNNIEFDHADIYSNVEAIEAEFLRLAQRTQSRNGYNIVNWNDSRVRRIAHEVGGHVIAFGRAKEGEGANSEHQFNTAHVPFPMWSLTSFNTHETGIIVHMTAPNKQKFSLSCRQIFGEHNAMNILGVLAGLHAKYLLNGRTLEDLLKCMPHVQSAMEGFKGVKRRFELLGHKNGISVFEDFAHHPTAIDTTLRAFRDFMLSVEKKGRLIVCFDPHNATLRRNVLQDELARSFAPADVLFLGKIPQDMRLDSSCLLSGSKLVDACPIQASYFDDNEQLLSALYTEVKFGDTIVFMSSGSFDGIPQKFVHLLSKE